MKNIFLFFIVLIILFISAEKILEMKGYKRFSPNDKQPEIIPGGKFFRKDRDLGFAHISGKYKFVYPDGYQFTVTNLENSFRVTHPLDTYNDESAKMDQIWIFGDSFVYGYSIDDDKTFSWLLQEKLPNFEIVNYGVSGYSTVGSLIQFKKALEKNKKPKVIVVTYSYFHDQRNVFSRSWKKALWPSGKLGALSYPYVFLDDEKKLHYLTGKVQYIEFPFARKFRLINTLDDKLNRFVDEISNSHEVTKALLREFYDEAVRNNIKVIFATFYNDPISKDNSIYAKNLGMATIDISVDYSDKRFTNLPHDAHPSAFANQIYAEKLGAEIEQVLK